MTLLLLGNNPMPYAWGSEHLIQDLTGIPLDGQPAAELWFGSHPASPAKVLAGGTGTLADHAPNLKFLVKFLAAAKPLSIQAHPSKQRASEQFSAGHPSYSDANHKPEMIIAVSEFEALCGFRSESEIKQDLEALAEKQSVFADWLRALEQGSIQGALEFAFKHNLSEQLGQEITSLSRSRVQLYQNLAEHFPGDVGLAIGTIMMNHIRLAPGEALFLPAGNIHAYIKGLGVEVMAASDNVLRGGLTPKRIDVAELIQVLDFEPIADPRVQTRELVNGLVSYPAAVEDFKVYGISVSPANMLIDLDLSGSAIVVCVSGELELSTSTGEYQLLKRGQAAYLADARLFSITGSGNGYLAMG